MLICATAFELIIMSDCEHYLCKVASCESKVQKENAWHQASGEVSILGTQSSQVWCVGSESVVLKGTQVQEKPSSMRSRVKPLLPSVFL